MVRLVMAHCIAALPGVIQQTAGDKAVTAAFEKADLPESVADSPDRYIPLRSALYLLEQAARILGDRRFGLTYGPQIRPEEFGAWGRYVFGAPSLGDGLRRVERAIKYLVTDSHALVKAGNSEVSFGCEFGHRGVVGRSHFAVSLVWCKIGILRAYLGEGYVPKRVELDFPRPRSLTAFEHSFKCPVVFERPKLAVILDRREYEAAPIHVSRRSDKTFADLRGVIGSDPPNDLISIVKELVMLRLMDGDVGIERVSQLMGVGPRTLQRRLNDEGTTYRALVSQVRAQRAIELLQETEVPVFEIAIDLGYSSSSHFARSFHRAIGSLPSEVRHRKLGIARAVQLPSSDSPSVLLGAMG